MPVTEKTNSFYNDNQINPAGTLGFAFLEFTSPDSQHLSTLFKNLGFVHAGNHKKKNVELWRQGRCNFLINKEPQSFSEDFAKKHGPSVSGMAFQVHNVQAAYKHVRECGAKPYERNKNDWYDDGFVIYGIGDNLLYFIDDETFYTKHFNMLTHADSGKDSFGLSYIDHVTHNVFRGKMNTWATFYEKLFNFHEIRYFDIKGKMTGLISRAMTSPCGKIRIPINESVDDKSQIEEFVRTLKGEGIQHIALATPTIYETVEGMKQKGTKFLFTPDTYYKMISKRLPHHTEPLERMQKNKILIDGSPEKNGGILLQIFTENCIGPVFFEIIQRKGDEGFGEGNFTALFKAMELDQIERGVL